MNTPALDIEHAIELLTRALSGMYAAGVTKEVLESLASNLADLKEEHSQLPLYIVDHMTTEQCFGCPHNTMCEDREPYGDGYIDRVSIECRVGRTFDCPVVKACGFRDPAKPNDDIPDWLRRQAS